MTEKKIELILKDKKIFEIVNPRLVQGPPDISVKRAIEIMQEAKAGYIVLARDGKVVGLFTETDCTQKILADAVDQNQSVREFMDAEAHVLNMQDSVGTAIDLMGRLGVYYIPLVDEKNELINVISVRTLIRFLASFYPDEVYNLPPNPDQICETPEGG